MKLAYKLIDLKFSIEINFFFIYSICKRIVFRNDNFIFEHLKNISP